MQRAGDARPQGSTACPRAERISPSNGFHTPAYVARASLCETEVALTSSLASHEGRLLATLLDSRLALYAFA